MRARPHYVVVGNDVPFNEPGAMKVQQFEGHSVYKMTEHLPFSFMVRNDTLNQGAAAGELLSQHVTALAPSTSSPNRVEVVADGEAGSTLVVLNRSYPGWEVTVDGRQQALRSPGGYLGTEVQQGTHRYQFTYNPGSFRVGLGLSLIALLATLGLAVRDVRPTWRAPTAGRRTLASFIRGVADLVDQPMPSRSTVAGRLPTVPRPTAGTPAGVPSILSGVLEARAVYQRGFLKPDGPLGLPERTRLLVTIDVDGRDGDAAETAGAPFVGPTGEGTARCAARMRSAEPRGEP